MRSESSRKSAPQVTSSRASGPPELPVLWEVAEEHLDEAGFLWTQWERALVSPDYSASEVADGPEERLAAHLEGLALGGREVAERLLASKLTVGGAVEVSVASFAVVEALPDIGPRQVASDWLSGQGRLKGSDAPCGVIPGEGAGFLLLCTDSAQRQTATPSLGTIPAAAQAVEPSPWYSERATLGQGLTQAITSAFEASGVPDLKADAVWSDLNGESWRADEWSYAYLRTEEHHGEPLRIRHPADCWGDVGAASGPMLVAMAALEVMHPRRDFETALVFTSADSRPTRSACIIQKPS